METILIQTGGLSLEPAKKETILLGCVVLGMIIIGLVYGTTTQQYLQALNRGITFMQNSSPETWNATDITAVKYISALYPQSFQTQVGHINQIQTFDENIYPFTHSLLSGGTLVAPSEFENNLGSPTILYRILTCDPFSSQEITDLGNKVNNTTNRYGGSHAILQLNYIKKNYTSQPCNQPSTATQAGNAMLNVLNNGLTLVNDSNWYFDAYLEQECSRGIASGTISNETADLVYNSQDLNTLNPLSYGGWWQYNAPVNNHESLFDGNGVYEGEYYPELPNGHTTIFAMCILAKKVNAT